MRATVQVEGLAGLQRALKQAEGQLDRDLADELREAGRIVEEEAHQLIREHALVGGPRSTGRLDRLTRTLVRSRGVVLVRSGATRNGFPYPRVRRVLTLVLHPAVERKRGAVMARVERMLEHIADRFNH